MQILKAVGLVVFGIALGTALSMYVWNSLRRSIPTVTINEAALSLEDRTLFMKTCPGVPVGYSAEQTDYSAVVVDGVGHVSRVHDNTWIFFQEDEKLKQTDLMRMACEAILRDFRSMESSRSILPKHTQQQTRDTIDSSLRYALKDYRHGAIVGLALLDQQVGRVWLLSSIKDSTGKSPGRNEFRELMIDGLWIDPNTDLDAFRAQDEGTKRFLHSQAYQDHRAKELTLPSIVRKAREAAMKTDLYKEKLQLPAIPRK